MGDLEPSSNQAGSGEQFKRKKSMSVGGPLFHKQVFAELSECRWEGVVLSQIEATGWGFWNAGASALGRCRGFSQNRIRITKPDALAPTAKTRSFGDSDISTTQLYTHVSGRVDQ
jgi:hypothetical protein